MCLYSFLYYWLYDQSLPSTCFVIMFLTYSDRHIYVISLFIVNCLFRFRIEYEKLHKALKKSHESEKRLMSKCRELNAEIVSNSSKVSQALKLSQDDQVNITVVHFLEIEGVQIDIFLKHVVALLVDCFHNKLSPGYFYCSLILSQVKLLLS